MEVGRTGRARAVTGALALASLLAADGRAAPAPAPAEEGGAQFSVAKRVPWPSLTGWDTPRHPGLTMSEGWACVNFDTDGGTIDQCWEAGPNPRAFTVRGMRGRIHVARDRYCEHDLGDLTFRCWQRPRRGDTGPRELPDWRWPNPRNPGWEGATDRSDGLVEVVMGETFACLRAGRGEGVFCLGDDRFGQLGSSSPPRPEASAGDRAYVRGVGREVRPAAGTWHACALAAPSRMTEEVPVVCWGRGDHGQLGAPAPDKCTVDGKAIACARTPVRGPVVSDQMAELGVGDLFTCVSYREGTKCWGANRDGLFGVRGSCPESLRRAWPTPDGPVPAPNASCTTTPVWLPGSNGFDSNLEVSPRRICYERSDSDKCLEGVPRPRDRKLEEKYEVSPGSDASACAVRGDRVFCWGEKYSPPGALDKPVQVVMEPLSPIGDQAIVGGTDARRWKPTCQIRQNCPGLVHKLPRCEGDSDRGRPVREILAAATALSGTIVRVRGALGVGPSRPTRPAGDVFPGPCDPAVTCCKRLFAPYVVGGVAGTLPIGDHGCTGDDSRLCCDLPAHGQTVVASGRLVREGPSGQGGWHLEGATVCEAGAKGGGPSP